MTHPWHSRTSTSLSHSGHRLGVTSAASRPPRKASGHRPGKVFWTAQGGPTTSVHGLHSPHFYEFTECFCLWGVHWSSSAVSRDRMLPALGCDLRVSPGDPVLDARSLVAMLRGNGTVKRQGPAGGDWVTGRCHRVCCHDFHQEAITRDKATAVQPGTLSSNTRPSTSSTRWSARD